MKKKKTNFVFLFLWLIFKAHPPTDSVELSIICGPDSAAQTLSFSADGPSSPSWHWILDTF